MIFGVLATIFGCFWFSFDTEVNVSYIFWWKDVSTKNLESSELKDIYFSFALNGDCSHYGLQFPAAHVGVSFGNCTQWLKFRGEIFAYADVRVLDGYVKTRKRAQALVNGAMIRFLVRC